MIGKGEIPAGTPLLQLEARTMKVLKAISRTLKSKLVHSFCGHQSSKLEPSLRKVHIQQCTCTGTWTCMYMYMYIEITIRGTLLQ